MTGGVLIVGCGRWSMGDDQAGLLVARRLQRRPRGDVDVIASESTDALLAHPGLCDCRLLVVVDAALADTDHPPGTFARLDYTADSRRLSGGWRGNSHTLGVDTTLELGQTLGLLPPRVWVYVLFGERFDRSFALSPHVRAGVAKLARNIVREVNAPPEQVPCTN